VIRLVISPLAERDLEAIGDYIAGDNPARALSFIGELRAKCTAIAATPRAFRERPELGKGIRSCTQGEYVIFFFVARDRVTVARVLHGAMDLPAWFAAKKE